VNDRTCLKCGHHAMCHANPPAYECRMIIFNEFERFCGCLRAELPEQAPPEVKEKPED